MYNNKPSDIKISVELDENRVPEKLFWSSEEGNIRDKEARAIFLSIWDESKKETLKIDLWTKEMPLESMKQFFHQTLVSMKETFQRSTQDDKMAATMQDFCDYFAEKMKLNKARRITKH